MSMHLEGPWLSTTSTKKRKNPKFKSAEHKARFLAEKAQWENLVKKYNLDNLPKKAKLESYQPTPSYRRETEKIPSLNPKDMSPCLKKEPHKYTGTLIKGIATMHKSNAVPVINDEQAVEIAKMRR